MFCHIAIIDLVSYFKSGLFMAAGSPELRFPVFDASDPLLALYSKADDISDSMRYGDVRLRAVRVRYPVRLLTLSLSNIATSSCDIHSSTAIELPLSTAIFIFILSSWRGDQSSSTRLANVKSFSLSRAPFRFGGLSFQLPARR